MRSPLLPSHRALAPFVALLALVLLLPACGGDDHAEHADEVWYCPMHPTYVSDRPGTCPICNMDLVRQESASLAAVRPAEERAQLWTCPMHPQVVESEPGQCPICNMDLVPVEPAAEAGAAVGERAPVELSAEGIRLAGVRTEPARSGALDRTVRTVGTVQVDERRLHRAHTKIAGWVERLYVDFEGERVRRGQPMLAIYSPELVATQEEYLLAKANAARFLASSVPEVRRGGDDLIAAARRRLELFDVPASFIERLDRTREASRTVDLAAPAGGYVVEKSVVEGMRVEPGTELYTVADLSRVWIEADFYESEAPWLEVGRRAQLVLPYAPGEPIVAEVDYIYPRLDAGARTVRARFDVANPELRLKPGMFVDVVAEVGTAPGVLVPDSAIVETGRRRLVFVAVGEGRFEPRAVELQSRGDGLALLAGDVVRPGERVVVKANFLLDSESRLRAALASMAGGGEAAAAPVADPHAAHRGDGSR